MSSGKDEVIIVGGGLVGPLCACVLAKNRYKVCLFEKRQDIRQNTKLTGKSINLALSNRARKALRIVGLEEEVLARGVPMKSRFIHEVSGNNHILRYDAVHKQNLYSINRNNLNAVLLTAAEDRFDVTTYFQHELIDIDISQGTAYFKNLQTDEIIRRQGKLIVGADGAHSSLRKLLQNQQFFSFSQKYIEHGYVELVISPDKGDQLYRNALHIWPRKTLMMIALPNSDKSWTVTLFMSFEMFDEMTAANSYLDFFKENFADSIDLLGQEQIEELSMRKPRLLVSIFCKPYHFADKFLLIGDAAHAMVPFYGQGMNAGFEDCTILQALLDLHDGDVTKIIREFTEVRNEDAHAICELAIYNYKEMSNLITKKTFRWRKLIDEFLYFYLPKVWIPLYVSVTFTDMRYKRCIENRKWQDMVIRKVFVILVSFLVLLSSLGYYWLSN